MTAALLTVAVIKAALGIWTPLSVAALPLLHQTLATIALTLAVIHAAKAMPRKRAHPRASST